MTVLPRTQKVLRWLGAGSLIDAVRGTPAGDWIKRRFAVTGQRAQCDDALPPDARHRLQSLFREDVMRLQDLIRRDLSHWLVS